MKQRLTINVVTSECDEWFDTEREAEQFLRHLEEGEYIIRIDLYENGVLNIEKSFSDHLG